MLEIEKRDKEDWIRLVMKLLSYCRPVNVAIETAKHDAEVEAKEKRRLRREAQGKSEDDPDDDSDDDDPVINLTEDAQAMIITQFGQLFGELQVFEKALNDPERNK